MRNRSGSFGLTLSAAIVALVAGATAARANDTLAPSVLKAALSSAVTIEGARIDVVALDRQAGDCVATGPDARVEVSRPIDGSGRIAVKLIGARSGGGATCEVWAWARVKVFAQVPITRRSIRAGDALAQATQIEEREIKPGHVPAVLTAESVADRSFGPGQMIEAGAVRAPGLKAGETVKVLIVSGSLVVEQIGRAVPCARGRNCAVLPSGKHIEGTLVDGRLMVNLP